MFMNVKVGQLSVHDHMRDAVREASRIADLIQQDVYTVQIVSITAPSPFPKNHGKDWSRADDTTLLIKYMSGKSSPEELAQQYERTTWAIQCRLRTLGVR